MQVLLPEQELQGTIGVVMNLMQAGFSVEIE
jgi:ribosomal protein L21E